MGASVAPELPPNPGGKPWAAGYFLGAIVILNLLCMNMVVATLINRLRSLKGEFNGSALLTNKQVSQAVFQGL